MSNISELLDNFAIDNIRLMQGSSDMDSIEKDRAEILQAFAEKDKRIAELEATVERMKCCGNCKAFHHCRFRLSDADVIVRPPENFDCNKWEGE